MKTRAIPALAVLASAVLYASCGDRTAAGVTGPLPASGGAMSEIAAPALTSIAPATGTTEGGTAVTLFGTNLGPGVVMLGSAPATMLSTATDRVIFGTPEGQGIVPVTFSSSAGVSNALSFAYAAPSVASVAPATGPTGGGQPITINGSNFGLTPTVTIGGAAAQVATRSHTQIVAFTPVGQPGLAAPLIVSVGGQSSNAATFTYGSPTLTGLMPSQGPTEGGTLVTLIGSNFGTSPSVDFGGTAAKVINGTHTMIVAVAPAGQATSAVRVTAGGLTTGAQTYSYYPPSLANVFPSSGPAAGGTTITITGSNFGISPVVTVGGALATISTSSHTSIIAVTPPGQPGSFAPVVVNAGGQLSNPGTFSYEIPTLNGLYPAHGPTSGGTIVTLSGSGFGSSPSVDFGGVAARLIGSTGTIISVALPAGEGSVPVKVTTGGTTSNPQPFTYDAPSIASISPTLGSAAGGTAITISGSNLGLNPTVTVDGAAASISSHSHTMIVATAPAGQPGHAAQVVVTVAGQASNAMAYTYAGPTLAAMSPTHGATAGGTLITLTGSSFGAAPSVDFGGSTAPVVSATQTQVVVRSPAGQGLAQVKVVSGGAASSALTYTYDAPTVSSIAPSHGASAGGLPITIVGDNFGVTPTVTFDGASAAIASHTHQQIVVTQPAGEPGHVAQVVVSVAGQQSNAAQFSYDAPSIAGITPAHGPTAGGTSVTITGASFGTSPSVEFGGVAGRIISASHSSVVVTSPEGQGTAPVSVVAGGVRSAPVSFDYDAPAIGSITPTSGPVAGGTSITIVGNNLGTSRTVTVGGAQATIVSGSHTQLVVTSPAGSPAAPAPVVVTVAGKQSNSASFTYLCPSGTIAYGDACVTPVAYTEAVIATLPPDVQGPLADLAAQAATKLNDGNPANDVAACGQTGAMLNQVNSLEKRGKISSTQATAMRKALGYVQAQAGCK